MIKILNGKETDMKDILKIIKGMDKENSFWADGDICDEEWIEDNRAGFGIL